MSIRMVLAKLSVLAAGGVMIGGGAVHVAETQAAGTPQYVKHAKVHTTARYVTVHTTRVAHRVAVAHHRHLAARTVYHTPRHARRLVRRTVSCGPQYGMNGAGFQGANYMANGNMVLDQAIIMQ